MFKPMTQVKHGLRITGAATVLRVAVFPVSTVDVLDSTIPGLLAMLVALLRKSVKKWLLIDKYFLLPWTALQ
jgi:hypothetical protein